MSPEELKAKEQRVFEEVLNNRDLSQVEEFFAPEYTLHGMDPSLRGPDGFRQIFESLLISFPDVHFTTDDFIAEGDKIVVRWTGRGTQLGNFGPFPPTGKEVTWSGISILRVDSQGKTLEEWLIDNILQQVGNITQPTLSQAPA